MNFIENIDENWQYLMVIQRNREKKIDFGIPAMVYNNQKEILQRIYVQNVRHENGFCNKIREELMLKRFFQPCGCTATIVKLLQLQ